MSIRDKTSAQACTFRDCCAWSQLQEIARAQTRATFPRELACHRCSPFRPRARAHTHTHTHTHFKRLKGDFFPANFLAIFAAIFSRHAVLQLAIDRVRLPVEIEEQHEVQIVKLVRGWRPGTHVARHVLVAVPKRVRAGQRHDFLIRKAHTPESLSQTASRLGGVSTIRLRQAPVGGDGARVQRIYSAVPPASARCRA